MCEQKFFRCKHCGNFVGLIKNAGIPMICCGEEMEEQIPNTMDTAIEKHVPEVTVIGDTITVKIGSVTHPMEVEHHIEFVYLQTENGGQRKCLKVGTEPTVSFKFVDDKPFEVFAYCNLHGLWKNKVRIQEHENIL